MGKKQLTLSNNCVIGGVCGGIAEYFYWDPTIVRVIFILLAVFGIGSSILIYLILWLIIPKKKKRRCNSDRLSRDWKAAGQNS